MHPKVKTRMSTILKVGDAVRHQPRLETFQMRDLHKDVDAVITAARSKARQILAEARQQAQMIREQSRQEGLERGTAEGYQAGREQGRQEAFDRAQQRFSADLDQLAQALVAAAGDINAKSQARLEAAEQDLLEFAVQIAERVTKIVGAADTDVAQANLQSALMLVMSQSALVVKVHPGDLGALETFARHQLEKLTDFPHIDFVADESIAAGGVIVSSAAGEIDATLEAQIEQIATALTMGQAS